MSGFEIEDTRSITLERVAPLADMYVLSPYVWREQGRERGVYHLLVRAVNHADDPRQKVARIYHGQSDDGARFVMDREPVFPPGPGADDHDGCEDPSVAWENGRYYVFYTGWNGETETGQLLVAAGPDLAHLAKRGPVLPPSARYQSTKEAEIVPAGAGGWRLFIEYAADNRSQIGLASARTLDGPWTYDDPPFTARPDHFDAWHLSTGPVVGQKSERPVMFYNGATRDTKWRIGWVTFDATLETVVDRCEEPLIVPPPPKGTATDIAFAASAVEQGERIWLYYSLSDETLMRATLRRR